MEMYTISTYHFMNNAAVSILVYIIWWAYVCIFAVYIPRNVITDS